LCDASVEFKAGQGKVVSARAIFANLNYTEVSVALIAQITVNIGINGPGGGYASLFEEFLLIFKFNILACIASPINALVKLHPGATVI